MRSRQVGLRVDRLDKNGRYGPLRQRVSQPIEELGLRTIGHVWQTMDVRQRHMVIPPAETRGRQRLAVRGTVETDEASAPRGDPRDTQRELRGLHAGRIQTCQSVGRGEERLHLGLRFGADGGGQDAGVPDAPELVLQTCHDGWIVVAEQNGSGTAE